MCTGIQGKGSGRLSPSSRAAAYDWPGNLRELENIIERSVALAVRSVIGLDDLPPELAMNELVPGRRRTCYGCSSTRTGIRALVAGGPA
jgi:DNA-binding NtrC family response regulator